MKKHFTFIFFALLLSVCYTSFAQKNTTTISTPIKNLIAKKRTYNKLVKKGFTIQLFNGNETTARQTLSRFETNHPETEAKLLYQTPDWKVQVGHYNTRLDADRARLIFKKDFFNTIVVPIGK